MRNGNKQPNLMTLQERKGEAVLPNVVASLNVTPKQSNADGIINALNGFAALRQKEVAIKEDQKKKDNFELGKRNASLGIADATLEGNSDYDKGLATQQTLAKGMAWGNDAKVRLQTAMLEDKDFDSAKFQAFVQEEYQSFVGSVDANTPVAVQTANAMANQFTEGLYSNFAQLKFKNDVAKSEDAFTMTLGEAFKGGAIKSSTDIKSLIDNADLNGAVDRDRLESIAFATVQMRIEEGDIGAAELIKPFADDNIQLRMQVETAVRRGTIANEQRAEEERKQRIYDDLPRWNSVYSAIDNGTFSMAQGRWLVDNKYASGEEVARMFQTNQRNAEAKLADTTNQAELATALISGTAFELNKWKDSDVKGFTDDRVREGALILKDENSTPQQQEAARKHIVQWSAVAAKNGVFPAHVVRLINGIDFTDPQSHTAAVKIARDLSVNTEMRRTLQHFLPPATYAKVQLINDAVEATGSLEAGLMQLSKRQVRDPNQVRTSLTSKANLQETQSKVREIAGDSKVRNLLFSKVQAGAQIYAVQGLDDSVAIEKAAIDAEQKYTPRGDMLFNTSALGVSDKKEFGRMLSAVEADVAKAQKAQPGRFIAVQSPENPKKFNFVDSDSPMQQLVVGSNGKIVEVSYDDIRNSYGNALQNQAKIDAQARANYQVPTDLLKGAK